VTSRWFLIPQVCLGSSNVTLNPLYTANSKTVIYFKHHKFIDIVTAMYFVYFSKPASHSLHL